MAQTKPRFLTAGRESRNGLAGFLGSQLKSYGTATVPNGATSIAVTDTDIAAGDIVLASVLTKGTNAAYVVGVVIVAATSFTISVNTDPGSGGAVIAYVVLRPLA